MLRPCFLVVDQEQKGSISTRKLVLETAKFNVITAYSAAEALEALDKFPRVDGVVLDTGVTDLPCDKLVDRIKQINPRISIVAVGRGECKGADHKLDSFDPTKLLALLQSMEPEKTAEILERDERVALPDVNAI